jgi:hypothetical protein
VTQGIDPEFKPQCHKKKKKKKKEAEHLPRIIYFSFSFFGGTGV